MSKIITLKDIAEEAGVSVMTVSRVVNGRFSKVSKENVNRIQKIIEKRGYVPNSSARSLSSNSSHIISIIIPGINSTLNDPYNSTMVNDIMEFVQDRGYYLMLHCTSKYEEITQWLRTWNAEGCILLGMFDHDVAKIIQDNKIPLVFTDCYSQVRQITNVGIDDYKGGMLAAKYLMDHGHRNIAFIGMSTQSSGVVHHRFLGFKETIEAAGLELKPEHILDANSGINVAETICNFKEPVTAIFSTADNYAISLIDDLKNMGYRVPDDYSIIGFDDLPLGHYITPKLTTITQNISKKAQLACDILFRHIEDPEAPAESVTLDVQLIERESVKNRN